MERSIRIDRVVILRDHASEAGCPPRERGDALFSKTLSTITFNQWKLRCRP